MDETWPTLVEYKVWILDHPSVTLTTGDGACHLPETWACVGVGGIYDSSDAECEGVDPNVDPSDTHTY